MNFLNIGFPELFLLALILLIVYGPERLPEEAKKLARTIRKFTRSDAYRDISEIVQAVRTMPWRVMKEVQAEEIEKEIAAFEADAAARDGSPDYRLAPDDSNGTEPDGKGTADGAEN